MPTQLRILEPFGIRSHNGRLDDASAAQQDMQLAQFDDDYATLHRYDASRYTGQDRLSYEISRLLRRNASARRTLALPQLSGQPALRCARACCPT